MFSGVVKIFAMGSVTCTASVQSISLLVTIYEQVGDSPDPTRDPEVGRNSDSIAWSPYLPVTATKGSSPYCVPGKYYAIAQATVTIPPYQDLGKRQGPTVTIRDSDCS